MTTYFQYPSDAGLRYPLSGQVVGALAEFLRLKGYLKEDWAGASYKTVQRYFQGEAIKPETINSIVDAMLDSLIPSSQQSLEPLSSVGVNFREWVRALVGDILKQWDHLAVENNGGMFPVVEERWLPYPLFRLLSLDLGIRWGGYIGLTMGRDGDAGNCALPLLSRAALRAAMDSFRERSHSKITVEKLSERVDVSMNTMEAWRQGKSLPTNENLGELASVLATESGERLAQVELSLRLAVGGAACTAFLEKLCGTELAQDFIQALAKSARMTRKFLRTAPIPAEQWNAIMKELLEYGARATIRYLLCENLAEQCGENLDSAADFMALPGHWEERMNYWAQRVRPPTDDEVKSQSKGLFGAGDIKEMRRFALLLREHSLRLKEFLMEESDWAALNEKFPHQVVIRGEDFDPVGTYTKKGNRARSVGDKEAALSYYYKALKYAPDNALLHYYVGCTLGEFVADGELDLVDESIRECREAARLDPQWNSPPTEIAIILSNAGRIEEAEDAYQRAQSVAAKWDHFHFTRANNLMWLERYREAADSYRQTVALCPAHNRAWYGLAAALYKLGDLRSVQQTAKKIRDLGGPVETDPSRWLAYVPRMANPVLRRADYRTQVGRNESCPCASGKKYMRCCGR